MEDPVNRAGDATRNQLEAQINFMNKNTNPDQATDEMLSWDNLSTGSAFSQMTKNVIPSFQLVGDEEYGSANYQVIEDLAGNIFAGKINFILANGDLYVKQRTDGAPQVIRDGLAPLGLRLNVRSNVVCITALETNGPAEKAGLMLGDKVIAVDKGAIESGMMSVSSGRLETYIQQADSLTLEIERNGQRQMFSITGEPK